MKIANITAAFLMMAAAIPTANAQHRIWFDKPCTSERPTPWVRGADPDYDGKTGAMVNLDFNQEWEYRSLPIGNGNIGANVMGSIATERLTLNEKTLWLGGPGVKAGPEAYWNVNKESWQVLPEIRKALADGDIDLADMLLASNFNCKKSGDDSYGDMFGSYTTLGEMTVETGLSEDGIENYVRSLDIDKSVATVSFTKDGASYERTYFASYPSNIIGVRFKSSTKQDLALALTITPLAEGSVEQDGAKGICWSGALEDNGEQIAVRVKAKAKGGKVSIEDGKIVVKGSKDVCFYFTADTDYKINYDPDHSDPKAFVGVDPMATTAEWVGAARNWKKLLKKHIKDYQSIYNKVELNLGGPSNDIPEDERIIAYRNGTKDHGLEETYFQFGRYLLISSSREGTMPANLQGIWLQTPKAPWQADYHNNINIQMNYWPALCDNLEECFGPLTDFIRMLQKPGSETAKSYWNARGWAASISANIYGYAAPCPGESVQWNYNPVAASWLATHLWDYYDYTRDKAFLEKNYDLIKECAEFCEDFLWKSPNGYLMANPSSAPEHGHADEGTTFAHGVIRELLMDAIAASEELGTDEAERAKWSEMLKNIYPYQIGRYGQLMEWSKDIDDPEDHHRHVNHLYGLHPGHSISPLTNPDLAEAAKVVLNHRGDESTGWSMGWKLNQWARLLDGERSYTLYQTLLKHGTADNLWDVHPPFQIDGNFGGTAGVTEMLLQSHDGCINLLPSMPAEWAEGSVKGLRARGNFTVDIAWKDGKLAEATIKSGSGLPCVVRYGDKTVSTDTVTGKTYTVTVSGDSLTIK